MVTKQKRILNDKRKRQLISCINDRTNVDEDSGDDIFDSESNFKYNIYLNFFQTRGGQNYTLGTRVQDFVALSYPNVFANDPDRYRDLCAVVESFISDVEANKGKSFRYEKQRGARKYVAEGQYEVAEVCIKDMNGLGDLYTPLVLLRRMDVGIAYEKSKGVWIETNRADGRCFMLTIDAILRVQGRTDLVYKEYQFLQYTDTFSLT